MITDTYTFRVDSQTLPQENSWSANTEDHGISII